MHEKIIQGVTIGVVAGLIVYWFTSKHTADGGIKSSNPSAYKPILGDVHTSRGNGTCADCQCCGLPTPESISTPLASDYLCCAPKHAASISKWNIGVSLQASCAGIDLHSCIYRKETGTSFPYGTRGQKTTPRALRLGGKLSCAPNVPVTVDCTEII